MLKYKLYKVTHKTMLLNWKNWQIMHKQNFKMPIFINLINKVLMLLIKQSRINEELLRRQKK